MTDSKHDTEEALSAQDCIQYGDDGGECSGTVEYRWPLSGTGKSYPRCNRHWHDRLDLQQQLNERYPAQPPADWSPLDAGEAWDEDDY